MVLNMGTINIAWSDPVDENPEYDLCGKHRGVYVDVVRRHDGTWRAMYNGHSVTGQLPTRDDALWALYGWMVQHVPDCEMPERPTQATELHVVVAMSGGFAREDAPTPSLVGVYTDPDLAKKVALAYGFSATVTPVKVDHIMPGVLQNMQALGLVKE